MTPDHDIAALFLAHQSRIYGFIGSLGVNRADAEDLLQETGLVVFRRADEFTPGTNFLAWACQIAHNKVLNHRVRQSRSPLRFGDEFVAALARHQLENPDELSSRHSDLVGCLDKLPTRDRNLIEQCYSVRTSIKQVAEQLQRPPNVVYKRLRQIRELLRICLSDSTAAEGRS